MTTYRVYHPQTGEPFDVPRHKFDELVLHQGWTQSPPEKPKSKPKAKPKSRREAEDVFLPRRRKVIVDPPEPAEEPEET